MVIISSIEMLLERRYRKAQGEEEGFGWIEGEGLLDPLIPLREAILRGDLRALYLFWLRYAAERAGWADDPSPGRTQPP